jgi:hypothetical protein
MDGKLLLRTLLDALDAPAQDEIFHTDGRVLYHLLDAAAAEFVRQTRCLTSSITLTTVKSQQAYDLPPDFIAPYMKDSRDRFFVRYYDGATYLFPVLTTYEELFRDNRTTEQETPGRVCLIDKPTTLATVTGTTTDAGALSAGQCILTDSARKFTTTELVYARDIVHNTTSGADGIVLSVTDATHLVTALFEGKNQAWAKSDTYVIQRATSKQLHLEAPPATAGHNIVVPYLCMPAPVFSDYGFWRFAPMSCRAICYEAAFMFKNRDGDYLSSDRHHVMFQNEVNRIRAETAREILRAGRAKNPY